MASSSVKERVFRVVAASTFTADFLREGLEFWFALLSIPAEVELAAYGQVFQALLSTASPFRMNPGGANLVLVRLTDLGASRAAVETAVSDLAAAVDEAMNGASVPLLVCICPSRFEGEASDWGPALERQLAARVTKNRAAHVLLPEDIEQAYPVERIFDSYREALGHVPYTEQYFAALATSLARRLRCLAMEPKKVVVVDCDDTLWGGLCAEAGPAGVTIDETRRSLHEFLIEQRSAGMLICICSRNNERDVSAVFDERADLMLRREHITSWRVNWQPKSESIASIAAELSLGVDSFVFLDDDAFVCAEVRERCPGIVALCLPRDLSTIPTFLRHAWVFDRLRVTEEDRQRADLYEQNASRERARGTMSLGEFLGSLELQIRLEPLTEERIPRVAQLTQRTNQFNATTVRRSEAEIANLERRGQACVTVDVTDRFGSYGLVGVVIYGATTDGALRVDTFLLSCRVLGRGVEHRILAELGRIAIDRGLRAVVIPFRPTAKNAPFATFFSGLDGPLTAEDDVQLKHLEAPRAAALVYAPDEQRALAEAVAAPEPARAERRAAAKTPSVDFAGIAASYTDVRAIAAAIAVARQSTAPIITASSGDHEPRTTTETELAALWRAELGLARVGVNDDFLALGGTSLLAVKLLSRIDEKFDVMLPLSAFFDAPTIAELAKVVEDQRPAATATAATETSHPLGRPPLRRYAEAPAESPLSSVQLPVWILSQMKTFDLMTVLPFAARIEGAVDVELLQRALAVVVERQASLRMTFANTSKGPLQRVSPARAISEWFTERDLRSEPDPDATLRAAMEDVAKRPFDLRNGPVFRIVLFRLRDHESVLFIVWNHVVADVWSAQIFFRETWTAYAALAAGETPAFSALAVEYTDYARWESEWRRGSVLEAQRAYWQTELAGPVPELPFSASEMPAMDLWTGAQVAADATLSPELVATLERIARDERTSFFTVLLSAYNLWLARRTEQQDLWVGVSTGNRDAAEVRDVIGQFVSMVIVRTRITPSSTFLDVVRMVRERTASALRNGDLRYHELITLPHLRAFRDRLRRLPVINFNDAWPGELAVAGLRCAPLLDVYDVLNAVPDRMNDYLVVNKTDRCALRLYPSSLWRRAFPDASHVLRSFVDVLEEAAGAP